MAESNTRAGRLRGRLVHLYFRLARPMTLGARAMVLRGDTVFLVRHTYVPGWHMPGGGVEAGETMLEALTREVAEEGNISLDAPPVLHGIFYNPAHSKRDHVAVYVVRAFTQSAPRLGDREIAETGFFPIGDLPAGTSRATRRRLAEVLDGVPIAERW